MESGPRFACVVGARPNFMKMAPLVAEMRRRGLDYLLIHTGQHYSPEMSQGFFEELEMPPPHVNLGVGSGAPAAQTAEIMKRIEPVLAEWRPDVVIVVGDVNSTLAGALVAAKLFIPVAHVEAGLRSYDRGMPEEINRVLTDAISSYLFVTEPSAVENLQREGVPLERIHRVGNVMIDTLLRFRSKAARSGILDQLALRPRGYGVVTLHRPSNVDDPGRLAGLLEVLCELAGELPVVFPVHPRTRQRLATLAAPASGVLMTEPLGYLDFLRLMSDARLVLTDSGGIQEETTILQVPCLTLRENTERPVTIEQGTNRLVGVNPARILALAREVLAADPPRGRIPELWDGRAGVRILDVLERHGR